MLAAAGAAAGASLGGCNRGGDDGPADGGSPVLARPSKSGIVAITGNDKLVAMVNPETGSISPEFFGEPTGQEGTTACRSAHRTSTTAARTRSPSRSTPPGGSSMQRPAARCGCTRARPMTSRAASAT